MKLRIQARAKINWTLDVVGTLPNGYHDLDMLMQSVTLCDQAGVRSRGRKQPRPAGGGGSAKSDGLYARRAYHPAQVYPCRGRHGRRKQ